MPGAGRVALWDFDGLDAVTMEDVPPEGAGRDMRFFFEHSHFRTRTGDAIIAARPAPGGPDRIDGFACGSIRSTSRRISPQRGRRSPNGRERIAKRRIRARQGHAAWRMRRRGRRANVN